MGNMGHLLLESSFAEMYLDFSPVFPFSSPAISLKGGFEAPGTMADWVVLGLIAVLVLLLLLTVFGFMVYSGLFTEVVVSAGTPPIRSITLAYKFRVGPYGESGQLFTESCSISPKLCSISVYYDNPITVRTSWEPACKPYLGVGYIAVWLGQISEMWVSRLSVQLGILNML